VADDGLALIDDDHIEGGRQPLVYAEVVDRLDLRTYTRAISWIGFTTPAFGLNLLLELRGKLIAEFSRQLVGSRNVTIVAAPRCLPTSLIIIRELLFTDNWWAATRRSYEEPSLPPS
jgi:hypothetical protein